MVRALQSIPQKNCGYVFVCGSDGCGANLGPLEEGHQEGSVVGTGFGLVVRFTLAEGAAEAFDQLVTATVAEIRAHEPGTLVYNVHRVEGAPRQRIFYELYADRAAFEAHEGQPHTRRFLAQRGPYLDAVSVDFLDLADAKTIGATVQGPE